MPEPTVLLADDHRLLRDGTRELLSRSGAFRVVAAATTLADAVECTRAHGPDLALVDVRLPDGSGFDYLRRVSTWRRRPRTLLLTGYEEPAYPRIAFELGAAGYVSKTVAGDDLLRALRRVHGGRTAFPPGAFDVVDGTPAGLVAPTRREREVLREISSGASTREVARRLHVSERTVDFHLGNLFAKLGAHSRLEAVVRGREAGWVTP